MVQKLFKKTFHLCVSSHRVEVNPRALNSFPWFLWIFSVNASDNSVSCFSVLPKSVWVVCIPNAGYICLMWTIAVVYKAWSGYRSPLSTYTHTKLRNQYVLVRKMSFDLIKSFLAENALKFVPQEGEYKGEITKRVREMPAQLFVTLHIYIHHQIL